MTTRDEPRPADPWSSQPPPATPYGHGAGNGPGQPDDPYGVAVTSDDRTWAMVSHVGSFLAAWLAIGLICPVLVLIAKGRRPFVRAHAYESLNFQLNALMIAVLSVVVVILTLGVGLLVIVPLALVYVVWYVIMVVRASTAANAGQPFRYPAIIRFVQP